MDAISPTIIAKALDGLSLRSRAIAQNIAGASAPDHSPLKVDFEAELRAAATRGITALDALTPRIEADGTFGRGSEPRIDLELASATETSMRYGALLDVLGRELSIMRAAIRGGQ